MVDRTVIDDFLAQKRLAFVGVSHDPKEFSATVFHELATRGYELIPVNPHADDIDGIACLHDVSELPDGVDGAIVMVPAAASESVVAACIERGVPRIWLHRGAGPSSVSPEAVGLCREHGVEVVDGACPLMFAEPVAWFHRVHRVGVKLSGRISG